MAKLVKPRRPVKVHFIHHVESSCLFRVYSEKELQEALDAGCDKISYEMYQELKHEYEESI